jgi:hypothetical protein
MTDDALDQLSAHVRYRLANRVEYARPWRVDALTRLVVRHWPHSHLEAVAAYGRNHKGVAHAMALARAQVREQWEARHGIGPLWNLVLAGTVAGICEIVLGLWWSDERWRPALREMARRAAEADRAG